MSKNTTEIHIILFNHCIFLTNKTLIQTTSDDLKNVSQLQKYTFTCWVKHTNLSAEVTNQHSPEMRRLQVNMNVQVRNVVSWATLHQQSSMQQKLFFYHLQQANVTFLCGVSSAAEALLVVAWQQSSYMQASCDELVHFSVHVIAICSLLDCETLLHVDRTAAATTHLSQCNNHKEQLKNFASLSNTLSLTVIVSSRTPHQHADMLFLPSAMYSFQFRCTLNWR